jgi:hypothetical protein
VKLTFAKGARVPDPSRLFNSSLEGNTRRAIDIREGEKVNAAAFKALVKAAVVQNSASAKKSSTRPRATKSWGEDMAGKASRKSARLANKKTDAKRIAAKPTLLAGGNPQIPKGDGDAPVQAYIAAMPGWKRDLGRRLDALIVRAVPGVRKAVKWNSPFYGVENQGWFLSFHTFTNYVKVAFFRGTLLHPLPPGESKHKDVRYLDIREEDQLDEAQFVGWVRQAATLPGWVP